VEVEWQKEGDLNDGASHLGVFTDGGLLGGTFTFLSGTLDPTTAAGITPDTVGLAALAGVDANRGLGVRSIVVLVDRDEVTAEIMFAGEGASASCVAALEGLDTVRVMGRDMGLQVECPCETTITLGAAVLLAGIGVATAAFSGVIDGREGGASVGVGYRKGWQLDGSRGERWVARRRWVDGSHRVEASWGLLLHVLFHQHTEL
jgi:hypothetical protein